MNQNAVTIFNAALGAVDPYAAVKDHVDRIRTICREEGLTKIYVVALGKAAYPMTRALVDCAAGSYCGRRRRHEVRSRPGWPLLGQHHDLRSGAPRA